MLIHFFILLILIFITILTLSDIDQNSSSTHSVKQSYDPNYYDYNKENPRALRQGTIVAGTVYSEYPDEIPGLGWLL